jgi:two-component system, cell cycle response regulator DivK
MVAPQAENHHATILYVEDNPENRLLIRRVLNSEGYNVSEAGSAAQAIKVLHEQMPDLILMDINMPDIDGYALTAHLKAQSNLKHIPIIAMTANALKGDRERSLAAGCDGYIEKPVNVDTLTDQIVHFLQRKFQ